MVFVSSQSGFNRKSPPGLYPAGSHKPECIMRQRTIRLMADFTRHQKKIVDRYYENKNDIMLTKLSELVGELYLADSDKKRDRLWERVGLAMKNLKVKTQIAARILERRDPKVLAAHRKDWLWAG